MAEPVEINDVGTIGVITDTKPWMLPPEAWSFGTNMRFVDGDLEKLLGWEQVFGTPNIAPHFAIAVRTAAATFWLYTSLTKATAFDGSTHTDVTRTVGGDYTASQTREWNGTLLAGIPIVNNGIDVPQYWPTVALATKLANLTNWPATLRAKVIRAFGPFLMAIGISKAGVPAPHMVKWSHPADPGTLPNSWDETDVTKDAGETELPDVDAGILLDALPLSETMYFYKESSVWKGRFVGGRAIFDFGKGAWLTTTGILAPRCVCVTGDGTRQVWASQDDILWHDGNRVKSLLSERRRKELFESIDTANYLNCFMFTNPLKGEVWFCYPSSGQTNPNKAFIFNYLRGGDQWPIFDADGLTFRNASIGPIQSPSTEIWDTGSDTWDTDTGPWSTQDRRRLVLCGTDATKFYNMDKGITRDGVTFTGLLQRLGLSVLGKKRNGEWIVDFDRMKMFDVIWPKISGQGAVNFRIGSQQLVDGAVTWNPMVSFDPLTTPKIEAGPISGRALAIEISSENYFRLSGNKMDVTDLGKF